MTSSGSWAIQYTSSQNSYLYGIWGISANNIYAVGDKGTILHYNGKTWNETNTDKTVYLKAVWGSSASDVYAVDSVGDILHYYGN
jgi:hypothetical protein